MGNLANLQSLWLENNQLRGEIPSELGSLNNLTGLGLWGNQLSGNIPRELGNLANLIGLSLGGNQLSGKIPPELGSLANLEHLGLSVNELTGEIPSELGNLTNLRTLYLSNNQLTGEIPSELGKLANLRTLYLSYNQLTGEIPSELGKLANLEALFLRGNLLEGCIPGGLAKIPRNFLFTLGLPFCRVPVTPTITTLIVGGADSLIVGWDPPISRQVVTAYDLRYVRTDADEMVDTNWIVVEDVWTGSGALKYVLADLIPGTQYDVQVRAISADEDGPWSATVSGTPLASVGDGDSLGNKVMGVKVEATPNSPNTIAKWTVQFVNGDISQYSQDGSGNRDQDDNILNGGTGQDVIMIEFEDDVQFPEAVGPNDVVITTNMVAEADGTVIERIVAANPLGVDIIKVAEFAGTAQRTDRPPDETLVTLQIPDMEPTANKPGAQGIAPGATVTVTFRPSAGIKNPTESKPDQASAATITASVDANGDFDPSTFPMLSGYKVQVATSNNGSFVPADWGHRAVIPRRLVLSDMDGPRGSTITVVGLGFRNSITATIWNDKNQNGARDSGEIDLGDALITGSDDFTATITINNPPFNQDLDTNGINAVDGRYRTIIPGRRYTGAVSGFTATESIPKYLLESSIKVTPSTGAIGDRVQVTARDFVPGGNTDYARISIGGVAVTDVESMVVSDTGNEFFEITIPDGVPVGVQNLVIKDGPNALNDRGHDIVNGEGARFNMVITGGQISMVPSQGLVPNQTVTLDGRGFSTGGAARINVTGSEASISGDDTDLRPPSEKLNEGKPIEVDSAGNWASSFVLPIADATSTPGNHELNITDTGGGSGSALLNMAERLLMLKPASSRVGDRVDFIGVGFPADNPDEGADTTVTVNIIYSITGSSRTVATLTPDGSGNISGWFTVPLEAGIPSTNAVRAEFEIPATGVTVTTSTAHQVTRAGITLDKESGPAGAVVTINGEGFRSNTSVSEINFGVLDVRSDVGLSTDGEGAFETTFVVPASHTGTQAVTVRVGNTIASATFTVTADPMLPGVPIISTPIIAGVRSLTVAWRAPIETRGSTPIGYGLRYIRTDADETVEADWTLVETIWKFGFDPLEYVLTGLSAGVQYDVQLRAFNADGTGPWSATATGTPSTWGAIRYLSETYVEPGGEVRVAIIATGYGLHGHVVETLPPGFSYAGSDLNENAVVVSGRDVIFFLSGQVDFTYTVTASATAGEYFLSGDIVNENRLQQAVGGTASIRVGVDPLVNAVSFRRVMVRIDSPIPVAVTFSGPVFGFAVEDVVVSNGVASNFADGGVVYSFDVTPNAIGEVTVDIIADAATDAEGNGNMAAPTLLLGIPYDDDHDGEIDKNEANAAVVDYFAGRLTREQAIAVIILYLSR